MVERQMERLLVGRFECKNSEVPHVRALVS